MKETKTNDDFDLHEGDENIVLVCGDGDCFWGCDLAKKQKFRKHALQGSTDVRRVGNTDYLAVSSSSSCINFVNMKTLDKDSSFKWEITVPSSKTVRTVCCHKNMVFAESNMWISLYDFEKKKQVGSWDTIHEKEDSLWVKVMFYIPQKDRICLPTNNGGFMVLDVEKSGKKVFEVNNFHGKGVLSSPVDNERELIYTLSEEGTFGVFSQKSGELIRKVESEGDLRTMISNPEYYGEGTIIMNSGSWSANNHICVWDIRTWKKLKEIRDCHYKLITSLLPHGENTFLSCSWDGSLCLFDHRDSKYERFEIYHNSKNLNCMYPYGEAWKRSKVIIDEDLLERKDYLLEHLSGIGQFETRTDNLTFTFPKILIML